MRPVLRSGLAVLAFIALFTSCTNPMKSGQLSDSGVANFHQQLNKAQFEEMYAASTDDFKKASSEKEMVELYNAIHTKLGDVKESNRTGIFINATTSGTFIRASYDTTFVNGKGTETFNWRAKGDQLTLHGYNIQSRDLLVK